MEKYLAIDAVVREKEPVQTVAEMERLTTVQCPQLQDQFRVGKKKINFSKKKNVVSAQARVKRLARNVIRALLLVQNVKLTAKLFVLNVKEINLSYVQNVTETKLDMV